MSPQSGFRSSSFFLLTATVSAGHFAISQVARPVACRDNSQMRSPHEDAVWYLHVHRCCESFWRWDEDAKGILWADGSAVASREEIVSILRRLESKGPPPFGAIVQVLAACRGKQVTIRWLNPSESERTNFRVPYLATSCGVQHDGWDRVRLFAEPEAITAALERLNQLTYDLSDLLVSEQDIVDLAQILLGELGPEPAVTGKGAADLLENGELTDLELNNPPWNNKYTTLIKDLALLARVFAGISIEAVQSKLSAIRSRRSSLTTSGNAFRRFKPFGLERRVEQVGQFSLPPRVDWRVARSCEWGICAAGWSQNQPEGELILVRASWAGMMQIARWPHGGRCGPVLLALPELDQAMLHVPGEPVLPDQILPGLEGVFDKPLTAGGAHWLPPDAVDGR